MKRCLALVLIVFIQFGNLLAGNTGKILGRVTDSNTGEPLIGVNIILVDQLQGASSDENGEYFVLNITPGSYSVECSYIGYQTTVTQNVLIQSDQTTILDFKLSEQVVELDEKIVVIAERPLVQKDLTSSKKVTTTEEIKTLPVETYAGIMLTQAGVSQGADGALHIRGGRSTEIAYLVDGVSVANPFNTNGLATSVSNNSIQEMTVVSGAFNAEYGNAMSGIVNFTTKDGSRDFKTYLSFYSGDYISDHKDIYTNIDDVNPFSKYNVEGSLSGPLSFLGGNNTFFVSARASKSDGYLYGIREHTPADSANFLQKVSYIEESDEGIVTRIPVYSDAWYIENNGDGKVVPMNPSEGLNLLGKVKFQLAPGVTMRVQSLLNTSEWKSYVHSYKYNPDGTYKYFSTSTNNSLQLTHTLNNSTFYDLKVAFNTRDYDQYVHEDISKYTPTDLIQGDPGGATFNFGGMQRSQIFENSKTFLAKFDFTSQVNKRNLVKAGVETRLHVLDRESYSISYNRSDYYQPTKIFIGDGKYIRYPRQISTYLQDKLEYDDMIINLGLRYDYFNSDAPYAVDELQPDGERKMADSKHMLAPRLGISFPITAQGIIHLSYGHFFQMPSLRNLYSNPNFSLPVGNSAPLFGNANLDPEKTISYEIGLQQQFTNSIAIDVTGFYKDIRNLLAWQTIRFFLLNEDGNKSGETQDYRIRRNQDYGNVKGVTVTLEKRAMPGEPFAAKVDYTFQVAEGNDNNVASFFYNSISGQENVKEIIPLDWDQTHNLSASVTWFPVDQLTVSMIGKISAGYPYNPEFFESNYDAVSNSDRKPTLKGVDLRASYNFTLAGYQYQFFVKAYNLFDTLNERFVFDDTGTAKYTYANKSIDEPESFKKHYGEEGVHTNDEYNVRPHYYRSPREIRIGLSVDF
ncbi:MAG: TonB-dependent receptor [Calditrichaeota bacterium]|nr:MAG: TonB-dependent receptor [Calditrichota bacterium]MBL1205420.1 TonB-dependent receptor [Calditrichota bacterium]NOG45249.1 TonB-dependent receptor [Calditrichota bacterium]